jgi:hypothetical protein
LLPVLGADKQSHLKNLMGLHQTFTISMGEHRLPTLIASIHHCNKDPKLSNLKSLFSHIVLSLSLHIDVLHLRRIPTDSHSKLHCVVRSHHMFQYLMLVEEQHPLYYIELVHVDGGKFRIIFPKLEVVVAVYEV